MKMTCWKFIWHKHTEYERAANPSSRCQNESFIVDEQEVFHSILSWWRAEMFFLWDFRFYSIEKFSMKIKVKNKCRINLWFCRQVWIKRQVRSGNFQKIDWKAKKIKFICFKKLKSKENSLMFWNLTRNQPYRHSTQSKFPPS